MHKGAKAVREQVAREKQVIRELKVRGRKDVPRCTKLNIKIYPQKWINLYLHTYTYERNNYSTEILSIFQNSGES